MSEHQRIRHMPENEAAKLRTLAKVKANDQLPPALVDTYWGVRNVATKISMHSLPDALLVMIAYVAGVGLEPPPPPTMMALWQAGELKPKTEVEYKYRGEWGKFGRLVDLDHARREFSIHGTDGMRYTIPQADVRLPEAIPAAASE